MSLDSSVPDEGVRRLAFLTDLARAEAAQRLAPGQREAMLDLWATLRAAHPTLRRPAARINEDGTIGLAWSFTEPAGFVFTVDVDREGRLDWYLRDPAFQAGEASDSPQHELPAHVVERLRALAE